MRDYIKVIDAVLSELSKAEEMHPHWPKDPVHAVSVVSEESGELVKAVLECMYEPHKSNIDDVRKEAIQTTAMGLRFLISLDDYDFSRPKE